jgi:magnesium-transporting ATPase (P-type)
MNTQWFCSSDTDVIKNLNSNQNSGLTQEEVISRRNIYGYNSLKPAKKKSALLRFFLQIHQPLIYVLILSATLALFLGEYVDALVIYGVVLGNAIMGFWQENTAIKGLNKLSQNIKTIAHVIRDYQNIVIDSSELVPGDIVLLHSGEKVPADIRLLQSTNLQVDESPLNR